MNVRRSSEGRKFLSYVSLLAKGRIAGKGHKGTADNVTPT